MNDPIEQEIVTKGLTAPRITPADIEANIVRERYFTAEDGVIGFRHAHRMLYDRQQIELETPSLRLLTFCVLVLRNGFTCHGSSACASPENFDAEIGRKIARQKALEDVWKVMGYELRTKLCQAQTTQ